MEVLERKMKISKRKLKVPEFQVSYNNYGHIAFRVFDKEKEDEDLLIVLTKEESRELVRFIGKITIPFDC